MSNQIILDISRLYIGAFIIVFVGFICVANWNNKMRQYIKWIIISILTLIGIFICCITYSIWPYWVKQNSGYLIPLLIVIYELQKWEDKWADKEARRSETDRQVIEKLENISRNLSSIESKLKNKD